jgi:hypothetical protein
MIRLAISEGLMYEFHAGEAFAVLWVGLVTGKGYQLGAP